MHGDQYYMKLAIEEALKAQEIDEVPVGAVIVDKSHSVIGRGYNKPISKVDPTCHAEIDAIRNASNFIRNYRLLDTTLYVTVEPCMMCMGAIIHARIKRVVFGAEDHKWGAAVSLYEMGQDHRLNHRVEVTGGILKEESKKIIQDFFKNKRS